MMMQENLPSSSASVSSKTSDKSRRCHRSSGSISKSSHSNVSRNKRKAAKDRNQDKQKSEGVAPVAFATIGNNAKASALSLFDRLGGVPAVRAVIEEFYQRVLADERLAFFFDGAQMANLKLHQLRFFKLALTEIPKDMNVGALILQKHVRLFTNKGLNETHFDLVAGHLVDTMVHFKVSQDLINEAVVIVSPLRSSFEEGSKLYNKKGDSDSISSTTEAESEDDADDSSQAENPSVPNSSNEGSASTTAKITLLDKLGGFSMLRKIVEDMYSRIEADGTLEALLGKVRDAPRFKLRQVITLKQVLEGKINAQEALFQQNHEEFQGMRLTEDQYDRLVVHLILCLEQYDLSRGVIDEFLAVIAEPIRRGLCETSTSSSSSSSSRPLSLSSFESEQVEI